jgi:hypothetical protein
VRQLRARMMGGHFISIPDNACTPPRP